MSFARWFRENARKLGDGLVSGWDNLPPLAKSVLSLLPVAGDAAELAAQAYKIQVQKKQGDPVIITLSAIGLMADAGNLTGVGAGFNVAIAGLKGAYQAMKPAARAGLRELMESCSKNPQQMKLFLEALTILAKNPKMFQEFLTNPLLRDQLPEILRTAVFVGLKPASNMAESLYRSVTGKPVSQGQGDADLASQTLSQSGSPEPRQELKAKIVKAVDEYMASGQYRGSNDSNDRQELLIQTAIESGILRNEAQEMFPPNAEIVMASAGAQL